MASDGVGSTRACLVIRLTARFGSSEGSDPPHPPQTRRDYSAGVVLQETPVLAIVCLGVSSEIASIAGESSCSSLLPGSL